MNKSILITGGAGYIGSHITEQIIKKNKNIVILDNFSTGYKYLVNGKAKFIKGDIKNLNLLKKIIKEYQINTIIHLAAYLNINESEKYKRKYYENNVIGTLNLIKSCKNSNVKYFIYSSSCSVYGNVKGAVTEKTKINPQSYYAFTKYKGEQLLKKNEKKYKYKYAILRYFNVAGASNSGKIGEIQKSHGHIIKNISIQALSSKPNIKIYGNNYKTKDGTCVRDYIHISDLVDIHIKILRLLKYKKSRSIIVNCGYGIGYSVLDIVKISQKFIKKLRYNFINKRKGDAGEIYANTDYLKKIIKWKPKNNKIEKILKSSIKWEKKIIKLKNIIN